MFSVLFVERGKGFEFRVWCLDVCLEGNGCNYYLREWTRSLGVGRVRLEEGLSRIVSEFEVWGLERRFVRFGVNRS